MEIIMELARVTSKCQATISKRIREAANIWEGDVLAFDLDTNNRIIMRRIESTIDGELIALQETLSEWNSPEDDEAWRDL